MQKRGQITIVIALGIVILVVFGSLAAIRFGFFKSDFEKQLERGVVPQELVPVKSFIDDCLTEIATGAVYTLSARGGYLDIPEDILPRSITNPFSNSLELYPGSDVAYWFYESANGIQQEQIPNLDEMELELADYIDSNFQDCYEDLGFYENEGFEIVLPTYTFSSVNVETNHIEVTVDAPTTISLNEVSKEVENYALKLDIPLGKFYDLSKAILSEETEENFLEEYTIDMMATYEEIPYNDLELDCGRRTWSKQEVKENFKQIASTNIGALRLTGEDYVFTDDPHDYFSIDVRSPGGVTSNFLYSNNWPFAMEVTPSQGDFLFSDSLGQSNPTVNRMLNLFFCINNYNFVYDIKYPTLISLMDESGYVFQFANMVIVKNNQPKISESEFANYGESLEMKENICNFPSVGVTVESYDYETLSPISGADISYQCSVTTCYLGKTDSNGIFEGMAPACFNGEIVAQKEGYYPYSDMFSTNEEELIVTKPYPYTELGLDIRILNLGSGNVQELEEDQHVTFQFRNIDNEYMAVVTEEDDTINLIPGYYTVTSYVYGNPDFDVETGGNVQTECVEVPKEGVLGLFFKEEKCFEVEFDEFEIENVIIGGAEFEWNVPEVRTYSNLKLYGMVGELPENVGDLTSIFNNIGLNHLNSNYREPELS